MDRKVALIASAGLETLLNRAVRQAPEEYKKLRQVHGKVLCVQLSQPSWPLYFIFADKIQVYSHYEGDVTTKVTTDLTTLFRLKEGASVTELIKQDKLAIDGDLNLLQNFSHYLQQIEFDIGEPLSRYIGDAPTHWLTQGANQLQQRLGDIIGKSGDHLGQLIVEEYRLVPHKIESLQADEQLEQLVSDTDVLTRRITQLIAKANHDN